MYKYLILKLILKEVMAQLKNNGERAKKYKTFLNQAFI
jgi:hypothetical protein